jgi:hypothetical protein
MTQVSAFRFYLLHGQYDNLPPRALASKEIVNGYSHPGASDTRIARLG